MLSPAQGAVATFILKEPLFVSLLGHLSCKETAIVGSPMTFPTHGLSSKTGQSKQRGYIGLTLPGDAGVSGGEERSEESGHDLEESCFPPRTEVSPVSLSLSRGMPLHCLCTPTFGHH